MASLALAAGCGQGINQPLQPGSGHDGSAVSPSDSGTSNKGDGGISAVIDMAGFNLPGSPTIVITAPAAGAEVHGDVLNVSATITSPSGALIQSDSVAVSVTPPGGTVMSSPLLLQQTANVYAGAIDLTDDSSTAATFVVTASDVNGLKASATGTYVHDHGPVLTFVQPQKTTFKGTQTLTLEVTVADGLHPITDLTQVSAGLRALGDITLTSIAGANPFTVVAMIDLKTYSAPALDGPQLITVQATNSAGTVGTAKLPITVDNAGPTIKINLPTPAGSLVSGITAITADVEDPSGVDDATVVAVWGGNNQFSTQLTRTSSTATTYSGTFDVRTLGTSFVSPTLSVRASDTLGNQNSFGEPFFVDNTRPWMSMDSRLTVRAAIVDVNGKYGCSTAFSPIGTDVPNESTATAAKVQLAITLRARIEEHGNNEPGLVLEHPSGINESTVTLYVIPDDGMTPLAVDTDSDGICDDVNPTLLPTTDTVLMPGEALATGMTRIGSGGTLDFTFLNPQPTPAPGCGEMGLMGQADTPVPDCQGYPLLPYDIHVIDPDTGVYTLPPAANGALTCGGAQLDAQNSNLRGPICVVTRAADNAGNINVSYPLHLCIQDPANPHNCDSFSVVTTHCTGVWNPVLQMLGTGTCRAPDSSGAAQGTFADGEVIAELK